MTERNEQRLAKEHFGIDLEAAMCESGFSKAALSRLTGVSSISIGLYTLGKGCPDQERFVKLVRALDVNEEVRGALVDSWGMARSERLLVDPSSEMVNDNVLDMVRVAMDFWKKNILQEISASGK